MFIFDYSFDYSLFGLGRINEIIDGLLQIHNVSSVVQIPMEEKINALCLSVGLDIDELDEMIAENSPVLRSVKGHCFEVVFERLLKNNGYYSKDVGGDTDVDLEINGFTLQLKTPNVGGTTFSKVQYKTHKTHGAKSLLEADDYLHTIDSFADFLVGLISYSPFKVYILPKYELPRWKKNNKYIESPFTLPIPTGRNDEPVFRYINNFDLLKLKITDTKIDIKPSSCELMPRTSSALGLSTELIVDSIMRQCNFRVWDMSIRGFTRERGLEKWLRNNQIPFSTKPSLFRSERTDKADIVLIKDRPIFIQVKGLTVNGCKFAGSNSLLDVETQLSRGRINDDETQSRLYKETDFDYLAVAIDPLVNYRICGNPNWDFFIFPTDTLKRHSVYHRRINSHQKLHWESIGQYRLTKDLIENLK